MNKRYRKNMHIKTKILINIQRDIRHYFVFFALFIIGIILGIVLINNISPEQKQETLEYIAKLVDVVRNNSIEQKNILIYSIKNNLFLGILLWFMGTSIIGLLIVAGIILFRGLCLGYSISSALAIYGSGKGLLFAVSLLLSQNLIFVPTIILIAVSGTKFVSNMLKNIKKNNIRIEIIKHTIFCWSMFIFLIISSFVEIFVSKNILKFFIKYF